MEKFEKPERSIREKGIIRMRTITNYGMGTILIVTGFFFMFPVKYTAAFLNQYDPLLMKMFAIVCWLYGIFRIYRGYKKDYFRN